jgi:signal transduction histidine kinase
VNLLFYVRLISLTMGTLTYLFLLALILGHRRPRFFERILFFLALSLFLIYSGGLLEMNARIQYASPPEATRLLYTSLITLGMLFLPALLVHVHLRFLSLLRPSALPRWCWVIVYLFYAFPLTYLLVPILLFHGLPSLSLKSLLHWFRPDDLSVLILAVLVCAASDYNITRTSADPTTRRFFRLLGLASVLVLVPLALWQGFATLAPMQGEGTVVAIVVAGIFPGALLIYFALRHNFLEFGGQRNLVYALSAAFLSLLYLALVRRVSGWLEPVLPPEATASILLFVLVFAFEPLQRSIGRALQRTVHLQMERVQRLSGELQMEARRGDVESLLAFAERRICDEFGLASATITLTAPPSVHASQASVTAGPKVRLLLRKGGEEIGTLDAVAHGAFISGDARAALEFLAEQLPAAIDLCRLIEEKLSLERELAERERLALVGQMAASISHNLRNPLSSMKTVLQVLLEKPDLSETVRHDCALVVGEIDRLSAKLGQLLRFAKSSARTPPEQQKRVDLASLVDQVVTLLSRDAPRRRVAVTLALPEKETFVLGSEEALNDVISNLVVNAIEAVPAVGGRVHVALSQRDGHAILEISDDGPGIPGELGGKVFQPFFTTKPSGTGLGLAIVEKHLAEMGATIAWESPVTGGRGTRFTVTFPLAT